MGDALTDRVDTTCLIVGAGPVGLTAAKLLHRLGVPCLIVERREEPQTHPAAHVVNARTLEIWRQAGFDMEAILAVAKDPADAGHVNFVTTVTGDLIGRLPFERQGPEILELTPTPLRNISQHRVEPILAESVLVDGCDLRRRMQWESAIDGGDGVTSIVRDLASHTTVEVHSRYLIAADGAGSRVRRWAGIEMIGPTSLQHFVAIHIGIDLRELVAERPGVLHFVMDTAAAGALLVHDVGHESVLMVDYDPTEESAADYDAGRCERIVRCALGPGGADHPLEILGVGTWNMSAQVAERMRTGHVFLVGDAAHRFPPTGGLGLNTGAADAHALAWRIAAIERGWAEPALLDSYETERRPVAQINCEQSATNAFKMVLLADALGLARSPTSEQLAATLADPAKRPEIAAAVAEQATHFDMLGLQLGYCYVDGALARDGSAPAPMEDPSRFAPIGGVGERLPHAWLDDGRSTLDLVGLDTMTLFSFVEHEGWADAAESTRGPIVHVRVGVDATPITDWAATCHAGAGTALLVRPDQHTAWRGEATDAPRLPSVVAAIMALAPD